jgi:Rieske Fe-S protein
MHDLNRRQFVIATAASACACALADEALAQAKKDDAVTIDCGPLGDYPEPGLYDKFLKPNKVLLVREEKRLFAIHGVCTHKACTVRIKDEKITCPCHGSTFSNEGVPVKEPAKASLFRYGIKLDGERIIVDRSKRFGEKEWAKPESFLETA